ncbi:hypothetical protein ACE6H2_006560 [Prunus campanulata]
MEFSQPWSRILQGMCAIALFSCLSQGPLPQEQEPPDFDSMDVNNDEIAPTVHTSAFVELSHVRNAPASSELGLSTDLPCDNDVSAHANLARHYYLVKHPLRDDIILNFIYSSRSSIPCWETFASKVLKLIPVRKIGNLLKSERSVQNLS